MLGSLMTRAHTDREYDNQLRQVRDKLLLMAGHVESMIANAVRALVDNLLSKSRLST